MSDLLKYVGMDVHQSTLVIIVLNAIGQFEMQAIIKPETEAVREFFRKLAGTVQVIFEAGTQSAWLYELINPLVAEVVVCEMRKHKSRGNHADATDAEQLAQLLRVGNVTSVYKGDQQQRQLKELARNCAGYEHHYPYWRICRFWRQVGEVRLNFHCRSSEP